MGVDDILQAYDSIRKEKKIEKRKKYMKKYDDEHRVEKKERNSIYYRGLLKYEGNS